MRKGVVIVHLHMVSLLVPLFTHTKAENEPQVQIPLAIKRGSVENIRFRTLKTRHVRYAIVHICLYFSYNEVLLLQHLKYVGKRWYRRVAQLYKFIPCWM